jgi:hypothetical protein
MHFGVDGWVDAITEGWLGEGAVTKSIARGQQVIPFPAGLGAWIAADVALSQTETADKFGWAVASIQVGGVVNGERAPRRTIVHRAGAWKVDRSPREMAMRLRDEVCRPYGETCVFIDQASSHAFAQLMADVGLRPIIVNWLQGSGPGSKLDKYRSFRTGLLDGTTTLCDEPVLIRDAYALRGIKLPGGGEKVEVRRTAAGHGDALSAAVMAATQAMAGGDAQIAAEARRRPRPVNLRDFSEDEFVRPPLDSNWLPPGMKYTR